MATKRGRPKLAKAERLGSMLCLNVSNDFALRLDLYAWNEGERTGRKVSRAKAARGLLDSALKRKGF